jgi:hypothetical protein
VLNTINCWHFPEESRLLLVAVFAAVGLPTLALLAITATAATAAAMRVTVVIGRARRPITGR